MVSTRWQYDSYEVAMGIADKLYPLTVLADSVVNAADPDSDEYAALRAQQLKEQKIKGAVCRAVESSLHSDYFETAMDVIALEIIARGNLTKEELPTLNFSVKKFDKIEPEKLLESVENVGYKNILLKKLALRHAGLVFTQHATTTRSRATPKVEVKLAWQNRK